MQTGVGGARVKTRLLIGWVRSPDMKRTVQARAYQGGSRSGLQLIMLRLAELAKSGSRNPVILFPSSHDQLHAAVGVDKSNRENSFNSSSTTAPESSA